MGRDDQESGRPAMSGAEGREEFEAAANASDWGIGLIFDYDTLYETYGRVNTQSLWLCWQASRSQALEDAAALARKDWYNSGPTIADAILALKKKAR